MTDHAGVPGWREAPFEKCVKVVPERKPSVPTSEYLRCGKFPVVDQGAGLVAGYTNDEARAYRDDLPVVVFGDHTRAIKYVDFPFATGADGTKLLRANEELLDLRFLYFSLLTLDIPSRGYNRHFSLLREASIPVPEDKREQRAIAAVLAKIQRAVELEDRRIAALKELKAATMAKVFGEGLRGESLKQTEIGEIPESWDVHPLGKLCELGSGGTPARDHPEFWGGAIPWVKTGEIDYHEITSTAERITELGLANSAARVFPGGTLLMAMYGQGVTRGKVAFLGIAAATNQACAAFLPDETKLLSGFLYAYCTFAYNRIRKLGHGANQKNLSGEILKGMAIPVPRDLAEQQAVYDLVLAIDRRIEVAERRSACVQTFFASALNQLMAGQVRVTPLLNQEEATNA